MYAFKACIIALVLGTQQVLTQQLIRNTRPITNPLTFKSEAEKDAYDEKTKPKSDGQPVGKKPPAKNAGRPTNMIRAHIVGGSRASRGMLPWIVGIVLGSGTSFCGGSLITQSAILTAAHCAKNTKKFTVYIGMQNYGARSEAGRSVMTVTKKVVHKGFNRNVLINDIAILKLPRKVALNQYINTVKLPPYSDASNKFVGTKATVAGWGLTSDRSGVSKELNYLEDRTVIKNSECATTYGEIDSSMLCISGTDEKAICSGDSGGPLTYLDADGVNIQIGLVSFSHPSTCVGYPQVFTRVTSYLRFISQNTGLAID